MTKLDELIKEYCPGGVEYKTLGEVCEIGKGIQFNKENMSDEGSYPVINGGINPSGYIEQYNQNENAITISQGGASAGYVNWIDKKFWAGAHCYVLKPRETTVQNRYVFHFVKSKEYKLQECQYGAGIPALAKSTVAELQIPVPPLAVQEEIVRILDKFTSYGNCLDKELSLRQKQYEWTRQKLLEIKETPFVQMKDVCKIEKGKTPIQKAIPGKYPLVVTTDERRTCNTYQFDCKAVCLSLVSARGHGVAQISRIFYQEGKFALGNILCAIIPNDENQLSAKFLRHYLFYKKDSLLVPLMKGGANVALHISDLEKVKFPLPPLPVQKRIVDVLDNFDAICSDLKIGLPAEIDARKKQYEYYRDLLLSFEPVGMILAQASKQAKQAIIKLFQYVFGYAVVRLGDVAKYADTRIKSKDVVPTDYVSVENLLQNKQGVEFADKMPTGESFIQYQKNDILIGNIRPYLKKIWKADRNGGTNGDVLAIRILENFKSEINSCYLFYLLSSDDFFNYDMQFAKGAKMPRGSKEDVMKYLISLPPLSEQNRIVKILDRFDSLCNDISSGLPAEIEKRKKQYEYYRDKLLAFK